MPGQIAFHELESQTHTPHPSLCLSAVPLTALPWFVCLSVSWECEKQNYTLFNQSTKINW